MIVLPPEEVLSEVAYIAYHFHWPRAEVMALSHVERRQWVAEIARINERINGQDEPAEGVPWP